MTFNHGNKDGVEQFEDFKKRPLEEDRPTNHHLCEHGHYW